MTDHALAAQRLRDAHRRGDTRGVLSALAALPSSKSWRQLCAYLSAKVAPGDLEATLDWLSPQLSDWPESLRAWRLPSPDASVEEAAQRVMPRLACTLSLDGLTDDASASLSCRASPTSA